MKTKSLIIYIALIGIGIVLGRLFFASSPKDDTKHQSESHQHAENEVWTCSMHPQIREDEAGKCPICGMDLVPLSEEESSLDIDAIKMSKTAMKLAQVETQHPSSSQSGETLMLDGQLMMNENAKHKMTAHFHSRLDRFFINYEGQQIQKGQVIAEVYSPELESVQRELLMAATSKDENPKLFEAAKQKLRNWKISEADIDEVIADKKIKKTFKIRSHYNGVVQNLNVREGDHIERGDILFEVVDLSSLWAIFDVYEKDVAKVSLGDSIRVSAKAFAGEKFPAKIVFISPTLDSKKRSFQIRAVVDNSNYKLKPALLISGKLQQENQQNESLWLPKSAVLWTGKKSVVYVQQKSEDMIGFKMIRVTTGKKSGDKIEIIEGLNEGDEVAVQGVFSIDAAAQISDKPSMMNLKQGAESDFEDLNWEELKFSENEHTQLLTNYLAVKNALVQDDLDSTKLAAEKLTASIKQISINKSEHQEALLSWSESISTAKDIELARERFQFLSDAIIGITKNNNPTEEILYLQFCPMADDNNGAFWLSKEKEIRNPYFGSMMLKCGSVEEEIQ
ncbi:MAG: efflux RND transporter periplasmic adaptor subunit [Bacteroidota bacterium]